MDKHKKLLKQNELRRLMKAKTSAGEVEKINSPIAKYDNKNNLSCVICKLPVKPTAWKVHINSKQHKTNVEKLQEGLKKDPVTLKNQILNQNTVKSTVKSSLSTPSQDKRNLNETSIAKHEKLSTATIEKQTDIVETIEKDVIVVKNETALPENFFDPKPQSKSDSKDPVQEEWERFQKEIKEESIASNAIIAGEHEVATVDRQIEEIDEQIYLWSKVVNLEGKKKMLNLEHKKKNSTTEIDSNSDADDDENEDFEEFSNWRCKKFKI